MSFLQSLFPAHREAGTEILPSEGHLPPYEGRLSYSQDRKISREITHLPLKIVHLAHASSP